MKSLRPPSIMRTGKDLSSLLMVTSMIVFYIAFETELRGNEKTVRFGTVFVSICYYVILFTIREIVCDGRKLKMFVFLFAFHPTD